MEKREKLERKKRGRIRWKGKREGKVQKQAWAMADSSTCRCLCILPEQTSQVHRDGQGTKSTGRINQPSQVASVEKYVSINKIPLQ
jgi:hypothetical protein